MSQTTMTQEERAYADYLNDLYGDVFIGNYSYMSGDALFQLDPIAFRVGMADWEAEKAEAAE